jgi:hypothetical protein
MAVFTIFTVAPATAAPDASVTVPLIRPFESAFACFGTNEITANKMNKILTTFLTFTPRFSFCYGFKT